MKYAIVTAAALLLCGCEQCRIQTIHNEHVVTNSALMSAFNDERYIWEDWIFSTNRVESAGKEQGGR